MEAHDQGGVPGVLLEGVVLDEPLIAVVELIADVRRRVAEVGGEERARQRLDPDRLAVRVGVRLLSREPVDA
jgi:hypothetical protein